MIDILVDLPSFLMHIDDCSNRRSRPFSDKPAALIPVGKGEEELPTFPEYLENRVNHEVDLIKHDTVSTYEAWRKYFNVSIFNVHQEGDLTTNFVCEILKTETLCNELTRRFVAKNEGTRSNTATIVFDYDIMGVTAWEKGLIHPFLDSRNPLREDIKKRPLMIRK